MAFAAFDAAWSEMENQYPASGPECEEARHRLASAMLPFLNDELLNPLWLQERRATGDAIVCINS